MQTRLAHLASLAALAALCLGPLALLLLRVAGSEVSFFETLTSEAALRAARTTLALALTVTTASLVVSLPLAWVVSRTDLALRAQLRSWLSLPLAIPPYVGAIAWIFLANPTTGALNLSVGARLFDIYGFVGLAFVETSFLYAFVFIALVSSFDRMDSSLEEAARLSGASPWRVFRDIQLPLLRPAATSGALLAFLAAAASFGVPALIGGPARIYVLTTQIYMYQRMGSASGLLKAAALSSLLMTAAVAILGALTLASRRQGSVTTVSGKSPRATLVELGGLGKPALAAVLAFWGVVFVLPMSGIVLSSLSRDPGVLSLGNLTLATWRRTLLETQETGRAITNSLILAAGAATAAVAIGLATSYARVHTRLKGRSLYELIPSLPYATPGTVLALALIVATGVAGSFGAALYGTLGLIALAYLVKYLSFAARALSDGFSQLDPVLGEAARVSGATFTRTFATIWVPLLRPAIVAAWFLVFMPSLSELTMTILLGGPGLETIGTLIFQLQEYADAGGGGASVLGVLVVSSTLAINLALKRLSAGRYGL